MIISVDPAQSEDIAAFALVKQYNLHSFSLNLAAASWVTDSVNGGYKYEVEYGDETYYFVYLEPNAIVSYYNDLEDPTNFTAACDAGITLEQVDAVEESSQSYVLLFHAETLPIRNVTINVILFGDKIKDSEGQHDIPPTPSELLERIIALEEGKVDKLETTGKFAYIHTDSTQGEVAIVDGTTANTMPIRDNSGRMHSASPSAGSNDTTVATTSWATTKLGNYVDLTSVQSISGTKTYTAATYRSTKLNSTEILAKTSWTWLNGIEWRTTDSPTKRVADIRRVFDGSTNPKAHRLDLNILDTVGTEKGIAVIFPEGGNADNGNTTSAYCVSPYRTYDSSHNTDIVTIGALKNATDVVHTTGNETIAGNKTFSGQLKHQRQNPQFEFRDTVYDVTNTTFNDWHGAIFDYDKNGNITGLMGWIRYGDDIDHAKLRAVRPIRESNIAAELDVRLYNDGTACVVAPARPYANAGNSQTASDVVTKWQLEQAITIGGPSKTFSSAVITRGSGFIVVNPSIAYTDIPASAGGLDTFRVLDKNSIWYSIFGVERYPDGRIQSKMQVKGVTGNHCRINVVKASDDSEWATSPYRTYNANNTYDIVTIGSLKTSTDVVHTTGNETIAGTKTFSGVVTLNRGTLQLGTPGTTTDDGRMELYGKWPYIDFHYGATNTDRTARIWNNADGQLSFYVADTYNNYTTAILYAAGYLSVPSPVPSQSAARNITISTSNPSGGNNGDIWIKYTA